MVTSLVKSPCKSHLTGYNLNHPWAQFLTITCTTTRVLGLQVHAVAIDQNTTGLRLTSFLLLTFDTYTGKTTMSTFRCQILTRTPDTLWIKCAVILYSVNRAMVCAADRTLQMNNQQYTVKSGWNDHPRCQEQLVFPNRWSFQKGSLCMDSNGRKEFSLTAGWSFQKGLFQTGFTVPVVMINHMFQVSILYSRSDTRTSCLQRIPIFRTPFITQSNVTLWEFTSTYQRIPRFV